MEAVWMQAVGAAIAAAALFYAARRDSRAARAEMRDSIESALGPRLDALRADIKRLEASQEKLEDKLGKMADDVAHLGREVSALRGWYQGQNRMQPTEGYAPASLAPPPGIPS